jgi:hypothetical protein
VTTGIDVLMQRLKPDEFGVDAMEILACGITAQKCSDDGYIKNTKSVVLRIGYKDQFLLLAGDATRQTEMTILGQAIMEFKDGGLPPSAALSADLLKVGHHGSRRTSSHAGWIAAVDPTFVFVTSDRSGSLEDEQKPTGFRLPQAITLDLHRKYAHSLATDCGKHTYVESFQLTDYEKYNETPDFRGATIDPPDYDEELLWVEHETTEGIFSTLATIGKTATAADQGVQYRVTIDDAGTMTVTSTNDDFGTFTTVKTVS